MKQIMLWERPATTTELSNTKVSGLFLRCNSNCCSQFPFRVSFDWVLDIFKGEARLQSSWKEGMDISHIHPFGTLAHNSGAHTLNWASGGPLIITILTLASGASAGAICNGPVKRLWHFQVPLIEMLHRPAWHLHMTYWNGRMKGFWKWWRDPG